MSWTFILLNKIWLISSHETTNGVSANASANTNNNGISIFYILRCWRNAILFQLHTNIQRQTVSQSVSQPDRQIDRQANSSISIQREKMVTLSLHIFTTLMLYHTHLIACAKARKLIRSQHKTTYKPTIIYGIQYMNIVWYLRNKEKEIEMNWLQIISFVSSRWNNEHFHCHIRAHSGTQLNFNTIFCFCFYFHASQVILYENCYFIL